MKQNYILTAIFTVVISAFSYGQVLEENFDYGSSDGDLTSVSSWTQHSGDDDLVQYVSSASLSMTDYPSSGIGGHASFSGISQDVNRSFSEISTGIVYGSTLVNLSAAKSGAYFLHFMGSKYTARVGVKDDGNGGILFGIHADSSSLVYGTTSYALNTTYLLVFTYDTASGESKLYVLDAVTQTEPQTAEASATGASGWTVSSVALRQDFKNGPSVLVDGIRVATSWTEIMNNSSVPSLSIDSPANGTTFNPGTSSVDIEFTTNNVDLSIAGNQVNVTIGSNAPATDVASPYSIATVDGESYTVTVELLESNTVVDTKTATFSVGSLSQVATIAELRAATEGSIYELTGEAVITYMVSSRNQKWIQDATGAILIDDTAGTLSTTFNVGDGITGLKAKLSSYNGVMQFLPQENVASASSIGNTIVAQEVTAAELQNDGEAYESELITLLNVEFADAGSEFADRKSYTVTTAGGTDSTVCRTNFPIEGTIPAGAVAITGLASEFNGTYQVFPRTAADIVDANLSITAADAAGIALYPNPTASGSVSIVSAKSAAISVVAYNVVGAQVLATSLTGTTLDVSALNAGVYILKITQDGATITKKLVIK